MGKEGKLLGEDIKTIYEVSKVTNVTKQILDDFSSSITLLMFSTYINTYPKPVDTLDSILNKWEVQTIDQKKLEIETLINQTTSMADMSIGNALAEGTDLNSFIIEVNTIKGMIRQSILGGINHE